MTVSQVAVPYEFSFAVLFVCSVQFVILNFVKMTVS